VVSFGLLIKVFIAVLIVGSEKTPIDNILILFTKSVASCGFVGKVVGLAIDNNSGTDLFASGMIAGEKSLTEKLFQLSEFG
jgi:hypothetical protein